MDSKMRTVLLTNYYGKGPLGVIRECAPSGLELLALDRPGRQAILERAPLADYLLVGGRVKIDREILAVAERLKMIQRTGIGTDSIDLEAAAERDIPVYVNKGINARSVAEHTLLLMLSVLRKLRTADASVRAGYWSKHDLGIQCHDLFGKAVGLVGMGSIGRIVAELLKPFRVRLLYTQRHRLPADEDGALGIEYRTFADLIADSDIVSLHCPLTPATTGLLGPGEINAMKPGAVVINTARGAVIDEPALAAALRTGKIAGAGLDAFVQEPLPVASPLRTLDNVVLTPHLAGITAETFQQMMVAAFASIERFDAAREMVSIER